MHKAPVYFALIALGIGHAASAEPVFSSGNYTAHTVTGTHGQVLGAASPSRVFLDLINDSDVDVIYCSVGGTASVGGAGMVVLPPLWSKTWEGTFVPLDAVDCISDGTSTAMAVGAR